MPRSASCRTPRPRTPPPSLPPGRSGSVEPKDVNTAQATKAVSDAERELRIAVAAGEGVVADFTAAVLSRRDEWAGEVEEELAIANADLREAVANLQDAAARVAGLRSFREYLRLKGAQGRASTARMRDTVPGLGMNQRGDTGYTADEVLAGLAQLAAQLDPQPEPVA